MSDNDIFKESTSNPKGQTKSFMEKIQNFDDLIKSSYEFNANLEEKIKNKIILKKVDSYYLKKTFLFNLFKGYNNLIKERNAKTAATN